MPKMILSAVDCVLVDAVVGTPVEQVRDIVEAAKYRPSVGDQKVLIVWRPERLSAGGQNALNKLLEDVPEHLTVIVSTQPREAPTKLKQ